VFLPPYSPELNPIERLWLHLRDNRLSHRVFRTTEEIVDSCCAAWNWLPAASVRCAPIPGSHGLALRFEVERVIEKEVDPRAHLMTQPSTS
jgi:hypothetical protein